MIEKPLISIVTVCYNAAAYIEGTIQSVVRQENRNLIEYIIIDGLSNDDTMAIVGTYNNEIDLVISEKDNGIYDAMNKGIRRATGDYILFLNAGDYLYGYDLVGCLEKQTVDIFYGDTILVNNDGKILGSRSEVTTRKLPKALNHKSLKKGLVVSHQSFIPRRSIVPEYIEDNLSADIDWVIKCCSLASSIVCLDRPISYFLVGGISDQKKLKSLTDRFKVMSTHYGLVQTAFLHIYFVIRYLLKKIRVAI